MVHYLTGVKGYASARPFSFHEKKAARVLRRRLASLVDSMDFEEGFARVLAKIFSFSSRCQFANRAKLLMTIWTTLREDDDLVSILASAIQIGNVDVINAATKTVCEMIVLRYPKLREDSDGEIECEEDDADRVVAEPSE